MTKLLNKIVKPADHVAAHLATLVTAVLFRNAELELFKTPAGAAPQTDADTRAERMFNNPDEKTAYQSAQFADMTKALTGFAPRDFTPSTFIPKVGQVLIPVNPAYRTRSDDGYTLGVPYFVTNQSTGRARGADNLDVKYLNSTHGWGVKPMSRLNDEWIVATDETAITELVALLLDKKGIAFVDDIMPDVQDIIARLTE
jgi:hypothetical protein